MRNRKKIIIIILFAIGLAFGWFFLSERRIVYFSAGSETIDHRKNELTKVDYFTARKILKAFDNLEMKVLGADNTPPIMPEDTNRYNIKIIDGKEIIEVHLWLTDLGGRIYINDERYFADIYDELYDILRNYDDNNGLISYPYVYNEHLQNNTIYPAYDWSGDFDNQEFYTYGTYYCLGDKKVSKVFGYFGESLNTDLTLTEWYLNATDNKVKLSEEVIYNEIRVKLIQIYDLAEDPFKIADRVFEDYNVSYATDEVIYIFLVKNKSDIKCMELDMTQF